MNLNDPKIVVAIENAVCNQLEASGITADPFRLDGEKIMDVILQQLEGFVLVPKELAENIAIQLAESEFKKSETIFNSSYRDYSIDAKNNLKQKWIEQKVRCIVVDYKTLIGKAQEQGHD